MPGDEVSRHSDIAGFVIDRFLLHHLLRLSRQMDGDFESLMIWSTLDLQRAANSLATDSKMARISLSPSDLLPDQLLHQHGLRSSDLAQMTGVARETVRRKLERLQVSGKVRRDDDGRWHAVDSSKTTAAHAFARETAKNLRTTAAWLNATQSV